MVSSVGARIGGLGRAARGANTDTHAAPDETHAAAAGRLARARASTMPSHPRPTRQPTCDARAEARPRACARTGDDKDKNALKLCISSDYRVPIAIAD